MFSSYHWFPDKDRCDILDTCNNHLRNIRWISSYLDLNVSHFGCRANDGPPNKRREDVLWEVGACIAAFDKLQRRGRKPEHRGSDERVHLSTDKIKCAVQHDDNAVTLLLTVGLISIAEHPCNLKHNRKKP